MMTLYFNSKSILVGLLFFGLLLAPILVGAAGGFVTCDGPVGIETAGSPNVNTGGPTPVVCDLMKLLEMLNKIISFLAFRITPIIATIAILWAGIQVVTHPGNTNALAKAKDLFWTVGLGLIIVFSAYLLMQAIVFSLAAEGGVGGVLRDLFK